MPSFSDLGVPADLVASLNARGIHTPFEVQEVTIGDSLDGADVAVRAPTGSGKTLAFGIPAIARSVRAKPKSPTALILAPTRELAQQIVQELTPMAQAWGRTIHAFYGGASMQTQRQALRRGVDVAVACPGRLADLERQHAIRLDRVQIVVIDEADRMADMGFLPEVRALLDLTNKDRQTLLFSATLDGDIAVLQRDYQRDPVRHEVGPAEPDMTSMHHLLWKVDKNAKTELVGSLSNRFATTVVFCRARHIVDKVTQRLERNGVPAVALHGGRSQSQRDRALASFKKGHSAVLVATDVAARGIHVDGVDCVVHHDLPEDHKAYIHRSGRTARAGASGTVITLVEPSQAKKARRLLRSADVDVNLTDAVVDSVGSDDVVRTVVEVDQRERSSGQRSGPRHQNGSNRSGRDKGNHGRPEGRRSDRPQNGRSGERSGSRFERSGPSQGRPRTHTSNNRDGGGDDFDRGDSRDGNRRGGWERQGDRPRHSERGYDGDRNGQSGSGERGSDRGPRSYSGARGGQGDGRRSFDGERGRDRYEDRGFGGRTDRPRNDGPRNDGRDDRRDGPRSFDRGEGSRPYGRGRDGSGSARPGNRSGGPRGFGERDRYSGTRNGPSRSDRGRSDDRFDDRRPGASRSDFGRPYGEDRGESRPSNGARPYRQRDDRRPTGARSDRPYQRSERTGGPDRDRDRSSEGRPTGRSGERDDRDTRTRDDDGPRSGAPRSGTGHRGSANNAGPKKPKRANRNKRGSAKARSSVPAGPRPQKKSSKKPR